VRGDPRRVVRALGYAVESWIEAKIRSTTPRSHLTMTRDRGPLPRGEWVLVVDAVGGIDAYLAGLPTWTVGLGLLRRGEPWSTAVYAPALDDLYVASSGRLRWQGRVLSRRGSPPPAPTGLVLGTGLEKRSILRLRRRREAEASLAYHTCLVARGAADGAVLGPLSYRQAAPLMALLRPVHGELVSLRTGKPLDPERLRRDPTLGDPIVAAGEGRAARLLERIKR